MSHPRSKRLPEKLIKIRAASGLSPTALVSQLGLEDELTERDIFEYECGRADPPSLVVLAYAKLIGISTDDLIDDSTELPELGGGWLSP